MGACIKLCHHTGRLPEFQSPVEVPSCVVAKSILQQRVQKMKLPPNFLDEISASLIVSAFKITIECHLILSSQTGRQNLKRMQIPFPIGGIKEIFVKVFL